MLIIYEHHICFIIIEIDVPVFDQIPDLFFIIVFPILGIHRCITGVPAFLVCAPAAPRIFELAVITIIIASAGINKPSQPVYILLVKSAFGIKINKLIVILPVTVRKADGQPRQFVLIGGVPEIGDTGLK